MTEERINMRKLPNGLYLVRTQAGFNKARKEYDPNNELYENGKLPFPEKYPSVVRFSQYYMGVDYISITCTPLNEYKANLRALLDDLEKE